MQQRTDTITDNRAAPSLALGSTNSAISMGGRLIAAISCASESGIDTRQLKKLLLIGLAVLALFEAASHVFPILSGSSRTLPPLPFRIFHLILLGAAIGATSMMRIGRNWRWWTISFCVILVVSATMAGIIVDKDGLVLMALFVLIITSAVTTPWNALWQTSLGIVALGAFTVTALTGVVHENDLQQWLILTVLILFTVSFATLKDYYRRQQWLVVDLEKSREAALSASKAKSEFLSSMSHEIRTPMNAVLGMAELLSETELAPDQRHYLDVMAANGNALLDLINSILDLARIESGRLQIEKTEFDLSDLIDKTISTFGVAAHGKGLELAARIAPGVPDRLVGDPLRLRQVLVNLLGNAIKFTELGQVVLEVEHAPAAQDPGVLLFTVADTGIGIPPDRLESIFASFTQVDSSTTRKYGGSGLGLAIAQRLVTMMGGRIGLQSEVNKGSTFSFTTRFELASKVIAPSAQVVLSVAGYRVLVVDDNQINRLIVREMMTSCGAEVGEAESGGEALAAVRQACNSGRPFQIILLDMRMPGMDGLEVARKIRDEQLPIEPLILMLSSDDLKPQIVRLRELALDAYLVKPITRKQLFEAIYRGLADSNRNTAKPMPPRQTVKKKENAAGDVPKRRVLVAEDSPDNRLVISAFLRREPYLIDFAENGRLAVEQFKTQSYDMVLMDIQMPELDGLAATRLIRQWESEHGLGQTPIVALTASVLEEDVRSAHAAGCDMHVSKPVKKLILLETMRSATLLQHDVVRAPANGAEANGAAATMPATPQSLPVA